MEIQKVFNQILEAIYLPFSSIFGKGEDAFGEKRIYWIYLLSSFFLALYVYLSSKRKEKIGKYIFNKKVWLSKSAIIDYWFILFNSAIKVFILVYIFNWGLYISFHFQEQLTSLFGYSEFQTNIWLASAAYILILTLLEDFASFFIHYLFHKIPALWQFHKVHHSATVLNPITQYRIHPVELVLNNISYLLAFGLAHGFISWWCFAQSFEITQYSMNIFAIIFFLWGANLRHSHVRLSYFSWLENIVISPYQHQIHHSDNAQFFNKNLGSKLAIWDWMFGTLVKSEEAPKIKFGIGNEGLRDFNTFFKTLWMPFAKMFKNKV